MVIKIEDVAKNKIQEIISYHRVVASERTANKLLEQIKTTINHLLTFPNIGSIEQAMEGLPYTYRSIVAHPNYKIIYRIEGEIIYITTIWDCRQELTKMKDVNR